MKTHKEVQFYTRNLYIDGKYVTISFSYEAYSGASIFYYVALFLPKKKRFGRIIYGITEKQGDALVEAWDKERPTIWRYFKPKFT